MKYRAPILIASLLWFAALTAPAAITFNPSSVTFTAAVGSLPTPQDVIIATSGTPWAANDTSMWFDAHPQSGASGAVIHITFPFSLSGYSAGTYTQAIHFTASGNPAKDLTVTLILYNPTPTPSGSATPRPGTPTPRPTSTPIDTPAPTPSPIPTITPYPGPIYAASVGLVWTVSPTPTPSGGYTPAPVVGLRLFDCMTVCEPPGYLGAVLLRQLAPSSRSARIISAMPNANLFPGSHHTYFIRAVDAVGIESLPSNAAVYDVPVGP